METLFSFRIFAIVDCFRFLTNRYGNSMDPSSIEI